MEAMMPPVVPATISTPALEPPSERLGVAGMWCTAAKVGFEPNLQWAQSKDKPFKAAQSFRA
jgi:hypothetical protein